MGTEVGGTSFSNEQATRYMANVAEEARTLDSWHASGQLAETDYVGGFVDVALHLDHFPAKPVSTNDINLFHTVALVKGTGRHALSFRRRAGGPATRSDNRSHEFPGTQSGHRFRACGGRVRHAACRT